MDWSRLDGLTIRQLRVFCTVARLLSYTRAAQELGCQQPTVSALVTELERITQLTLLEQWGKRLALTDEGRELYAHAQQVVAAEDETWRAMAELRGAAQAEHVPLGVAASRLRGPYLAGATLAFAVGLPAIADKFPGTFGGENGLTLNPPTPPSWLGSSFSLFRWEAWVCCIGALVVLFALYNLVHSGVGRTMRAVRDDEIAAALCGLRIGRMQTLAFTVSGACACL